MDESLGILVFLVLVGLLVTFASYRFVIQRRQLSSGRIIGRYFPVIHDGKFIFENRIAITAGGKWCRLSLTLQGDQANSTQSPVRHFFEKKALLIGTPYALTMADAQGRVIHTEEGSLEPFVILLGGRSQSTETMLGERTAGNTRGTFTLLEFLPKEAGEYSFTLRITERVEAAYPGSSASWQVKDVILTLAENVIPLSKTVKYPHNRIRI